MIIRRIIGAAFLMLCLAFAVDAVARAEEHDLILDFPLLDFPLLDLPFEGPGASPLTSVLPSTRQSLQLSTDYLQGVHYLIAPTADPATGQKLAIAAFDILGLTFPLSNTWLHEEWHRAVLSHRNMQSFNDTYHFPIGRGSVSVSHVSDEDLVRLKRDFPADQVRLNTAGIEAQYEQNLLLEERRFFYETKSWDKLILLFNHVNNILYLHTCAEGPTADAETREYNTEDGADVAKRDFTGLDCTAWAYDLFRSSEPYANRGTHPSGVGINRYRSFSDLSETEKDFLRSQRNLSLLNLVDPFLFNYDAFDGSVLGFGQKWNATLRHHLTSFGYSIEGNLFVKNFEQNWLFQLHNYLNVARYFPGVSAELQRYPISGTVLHVTVKAATWLQPEAQDVRSTVSRPGGLVHGTLHAPVFSSGLAQTEAYLGAEAKSEGWVAGNIYLERNVSVFGGLTLLF